MDQQVVGLMFKLYSECYYSDCLIDLYQDRKISHLHFVDIVVIRSNPTFISLVNLDKREKWMFVVGFLFLSHTKKNNDSKK